MFETLGLENWTPMSASLVAGALIGALFGIFAQRSRFCLRRGLVGQGAERRNALGLWLTALVTAIIGSQTLKYLGILDFSEQRFLASEISAPAIIFGGLLFGTGMVLARGCASRLTVLTGTGNLRALVAILVFGVVAHATLKGVFAPLRVWLSSTTVDLGPITSLSALPGGTMVWAPITVAALIAIIARSGARTSDLIYGALIGALVPTAWFTTGVLLFDEFDPITFESLAFTSSTSETLFWTVAGTSIAPGFGVGFFGGAIAGSALAAIFAREFVWVGFTGEIPTHRYLIGGALMGVGGVLAGGCTVGAGLTGFSTLSIAALLALGSIIVGALVANAGLSRQTRVAFPAE